MFITSQKDLAKEVGVTTQHLSSVFNRRRGYSEELINKIHARTNIKKFDLMNAPKTKLKRLLREFYREQLNQRILGS